MRKRIISKRDTRYAAVPEQSWLELENLAEVELTSEDAAFPIESALRLDDGPGWRASEPGRQTVRLLFDRPLRVRHLKVVFCEEEQARTQEFVLRWSADGGASYREVVRQQYNFSPPDNACEVEEYKVKLDGLTALELEIIPDISGGSAHASIAQLRLA